MKDNYISSDLLLPFLLPIKEGLTYVYGRSMGTFTMTFEIKSENVNLFTSNNNCYRTLIKTSFTFKEGTISNNQEAIKFFLYESIRLINRIIKAVQLIRNCHGIYSITIKDLPSIININLYGNIIEYIINIHMFNESILINDKNGIVELHSKIEEIEANKYEYLDDIFYDSAINNFHNEDFAQVIINLQTSLEIFLRDITYKLFKKDNESDERLRIPKTVSFRNLILHHLSNKLDVNLQYNSTNNNSIMHRWYKDLYLKRNDLVHEGKFDHTGGEALCAIKSYLDVRDFISNCARDVGVSYIRYLSEPNLNQHDGKPSKELIRELNEYRQK